MAGHIEDAGRVDWTTPQAILGPVREVFGGTIDLDPCSNEKPVVGAKLEYRLPNHDGLVEPWSGKIFVNPPYGSCYMHIKDKRILPSKVTTLEYEASDEKTKRLYVKKDEWYKLLSANVNASGECRKTTIADWVKRCENAYISKGSSVILLVPAAVDTRHWQDMIFKTACAVNFLRGRVHFDDAGPAPMACALVYWGRDPVTFEDTTETLGKILRIE